MSTPQKNQATQGAANQTKLQHFIRHDESRPNDREQLVFTQSGVIKVRIENEPNDKIKRVVIEILDA